MHRNFILKPAKEPLSTDVIFIKYNAMQNKRNLLNLTKKILALNVDHQIYDKNKLRRIALKLIRNYAYLNNFDYQACLQDNFIKSKNGMILKANLISDQYVPCNATNWIKILNILQHQARSRCTNKPTSAMFNKIHNPEFHFFLNYRKSPLKHITQKKNDNTTIKKAFFILNHPNNTLQQVTKIYGTNSGTINHFELLKWISAKKIFQSLSQSYNINFNYLLHCNFIRIHNYIWTKNDHRFCTCYEYLKLIHNLSRQVAAIHHYPNNTSLIHSRYAPYIKNIQDYLKKKRKRIIQLKHKIAKQKRYEKARRKIKAHTRLQLKFLLHCRPHYLYTFTGIYKNKNQTIKSNPVKFRRETLITKVKYHGVQVADHVWVCSNLFALQTDYMNSGMPVTFDAYINKYTRHGKGAKKGTHDYGLYGSIGLRQATISASIHSQLKILPQTIKGINIRNK